MPSLPILPILIIAAVLRLPTVTAGFPYLNYVDEGHILHRTIHVLATGDWDPGWYIYGALPNYAIASAAALYAPVYRAVHGQPLRQGLSPDPPRQYNLVEPPELLVLGRLLSLSLALGGVLLVGQLARRLAGRAAGLFAAWLAAVLPALVIRGATINVDVYALFFILAALCLTERFCEGADPERETPSAGSPGGNSQALPEPPGNGPAPENPGDGLELAAGGREIRAARRDWRPYRDFALTGAMCGLALVSKYPAALVALPVALAALLAPRRGWTERLGLLAAAGGGAVAATVAGMPALALKTGKVIHALAYEASLYSGTRFGSYWQQAVRHGEWDQPFPHPELGYVFLACAAAGLVVALLDSRLRRPVAGWLLFGAALGVLLASYPFRPLRNLLPLIALACILVAFLYAALRRAATARGGRWAARGVDLVAVLLPLLLFGPDLARYVRHQATLVDSRRQAIDWLTVHAGPDDSVLLAEELVFLHSEIDRLPCDAVAVPFRTARHRLGKAQFRFAALGRLIFPGGRPSPPSGWPEILDRYEIKTSFGEELVAVDTGNFHGNRQTIYILERKPAAPPPPSPAASP